MHFMRSLIFMFSSRICCKNSMENEIYLKWKSSYDYNDTQFIILAVYKPIKDNYFLFQR